MLQNCPLNDCGIVDRYIGRRESEKKVFEDM
jgi:hypothetical protein